MLIDIHTHAFPDRIAESAIVRLAHASGGLSPQTGGSVASLTEEMKKDGVTLSVVQSIATNPKQMHNVNDFSSEINGMDGILAFGSVHPDAPDALEEVERIHAMGLKGIKFHPDYQGFYADDIKMKPIYKKISSLGLITLFHAGYDYGFYPPYRAMPDNILGAIKWFDSPVIAAHWGGVGCGLEVIKKLAGMDIWFDLSFGYSHMPKGVAQMIADKHTPDRLIFGSDMPWHRPSWEKRLIESLDFSDEDKEKIYWKNAKKLLNL